MRIPDRLLTGAALRRRLAPAVFVLAAAAALPVQAFNVTESGDAGQTLATAQVSAGSGPLNNIFGVLGGATDVDLFLISIANAASFSATTLNTSTADVDTQLFLLTLSGAPVYLNDDDASGLTLASTLPAGNAAGPLTAGQYYLGISLSGYEPVNANNQFLFASGLSTDTRGPAFGLQPATLGGYDGSPFPPGGAYGIQLTGAVAAVPEPSSVLLMLLGAGVLGAAGLARRASPAAARASTGA